MQVSAQHRHAVKHSRCAQHKESWAGKSPAQLFHNGCPNIRLVWAKKPPARFELASTGFEVLLSDNWVTEALKHMPETEPIWSCASARMRRVSRFPFVVLIIAQHSGNVKWFLFSWQTAERYAILFKNYDISYSANWFVLSVRYLLNQIMCGGGINSSYDSSSLHSAAKSS